MPVNPKGRGIRELATTVASRGAGLLAALGVALAGGPGAVAQEVSAPQPEPAANAPVAAAPVTAAPVEDAPLEFDCLIEPMKRVILSAPVIGVVGSVLVERGDSVEQGQLLATLESKLEQATVEVARARMEADAELGASDARLEFETRRMKRNEHLHGQGVVSDLVFDEVESARLVAAANFMQAMENRDLAALEFERAGAALSQREIRSTVDGVVVRIILNPGEYADPPQILELAQIDPLRVEVFVPVSALGRIRVGTTGRVFPEEPIGGSYPARVTVVDRVVDAASGTFGVRLELQNPEYALSAGLKCRIRF